MNKHKHDSRKTTSLQIVTATALCTIAACLATSPAQATDYSFYGQSTTLLRMKTTIDKKDIYPLYDYLNLGMTSNRGDGSGVDFYLGAWGRVDLGDKWNEKKNDGELQYAYLTYRAAKNNTVVSLGRQFVTEGVSAEKLDGLYLRSDFVGGIGAAAFAGKPVVEEPTNLTIGLKNYGDIVYGGRLTQSTPKYYTIGASVLKSDAADKARYRQEYGADIWVHPMSQIDVTGRSTYNDLTKGWMEHSYNLSLIPLEQIRIAGEFSNINYKDYFYNMTTPVFSRWIASDEELILAGVSASYSHFKELTISADYKHYDYKIAKKADYFGGKAVYSIAENFALGCGVHRMQGNIDRLRYTEYRAFASKKLGHADLALDFNNTSFDTRINGVRNSYSITGAAEYEFGKRVKVGADIEYAKNPDFDNEVKGLLKLTYLFDTKKSEGRSK